jgi:hypothetical protein
MRISDTIASTCPISIHSFERNGSHQFGTIPMELWESLSNAPFHYPREATRSATSSNRVLILMSSPSQSSQKIEGIEWLHSRPPIPSPHPNHSHHSNLPSLLLLLVILMTTPQRRHLHQQWRQQQFIRTLQLS